MSIAAAYYRRCRAAGLDVTPASALSWASQRSWGCAGYFNADAALDAGIGVRTPDGLVVRPPTHPPHIGVGMKGTNDAIEELLLGAEVGL